MNEAQRRSAGCRPSTGRMPPGCAVYRKTGQRRRDTAKTFDGRADLGDLDVLDLSRPLPHAIAYLTVARDSEQNERASLQRVARRAARRELPDVAEPPEWDGS